MGPMAIAERAHAPRTLGAALVTRRRPLGSKWRQHCAAGDL